MNLQALILKQGILDRNIKKRTGVTPEIEEKIELALLVELGELANEVQSFKYWKLNKNQDYSKIKEEWADCLHFALMIERRRKQVRTVINPLLWFDEIPTSLMNNPEEMTCAFKDAFSMIINNTDLCPLKTIIRLGFQVGMTEKEMVAEYDKKWQKNLTRQKENY